MSYWQKPVNVSTDGLSENHEKIILWVLDSISWTVAPFAILMNALVVIVVSPRKEPQKTSNILLSSIALADFLTDIASIPAISTTMLIVHQGSLEFLRTINKVAINLEGFFFFCSPYHLTIVAWERFVAVRKWMHYNVIMAKQRIIKFAIFACSWRFLHGCLYTLWLLLSRTVRRDESGLWLWISLESLTCYHRLFLAMPWSTTEYENVGRIIWTIRPP